MSYVNRRLSKGLQNYNIFLEYANFNHSKHVFFMNQNKYYAILGKIMSEGRMQLNKKGEHQVFNKSSAQFGTR